MEIVTFIPTTAVNPYTEDIATLLAATNENPNAAGVFTVKNSDSIKHKKLIADAANAVGKTASFGTRTVVESTETRFVVKLTHKHKARRNAERESAAKGGLINPDTLTPVETTDALNASNGHATVIESVERHDIADEIKPAPKPRAARK